jgi:hypothetical protein
MYMKKSSLIFWIVVGLFLLLVAGIWTIWTVGASQTWRIPDSCLTSDNKGVKAGDSEFDRCMEGMKRQAEIYMASRYNDFKDTIKAFIPVIIGTFVASIAFSEKIVGLSTTTLNLRFTLSVCWFSLLASIILSGIALVYFNLAFSQASIRPDVFDLEIVNRGIIFLLGSFSLFAAGLVLMFSAALFSQLSRSDVPQGIPSK